MSHFYFSFCEKVQVSKIEHIGDEGIRKLAIFSTIAHKEGLVCPHGCAQVRCCNVI